MGNVAPRQYVPARIRTRSSGRSIEWHLLRSQTSLQTLRWRIKKIWITVALVLAIGFEVYYLVFFRNEEDRTRSQRNPIYVGLESFIMELTFNLRLLGFALAPLIDDACFFRFLALTDVFLIAFGRWLSLIQDRIDVDAVRIGMKLSHHVRSLIACGMLMFAISGRSSSVIQNRIWSALAVFILWCLADLVFYIFWVAVEHHQLTPHVTNIFALAPLVIVSLSRNIRTSIQRVLWRWLEATAADLGAASLACLLGKVEPHEAMALAAGRFSCVPLQALTPEVMLDKAPNPAHSALAYPCVLHECDAFLSHSWSDDAAAKRSALGTWAAEFSRERGRKPSLWFDKCCIDQTRIDDDLACLPIFLKGCKSLVVLCGPTYLSQLWCIIDIFTHVHMGGRPEDIEVVQVLREGHERDDARAIMDSFRNFDVRGCTCFDPGDKQRLVHVIEMAFGGAHNFNQVVQSITGEVRQQLTIRSVVVPVPANRLCSDSSDSDTTSIASSSSSDRCEDRAAGTPTVANE